jgi:hypothetical protein
MIQNKVGDGSDESLNKSDSSLARLDQIILDKPEVNSNILQNINVVTSKMQIESLELSPGLGKKKLKDD